MKEKHVDEFIASLQSLIESIKIQKERSKDSKSSAEINEIVLTTDNLIIDLAIHEKGTPKFSM